MKTVILLIASFSMIACTQTASSISTSEANDIANTLRYVKDSRTNQCFAVVASQHVAELTQNGFTVTWVPCDPQVLKQIGN